MATVIDSLVVKLGLDSSDFERGEKRVAEGLDKTRKSADRVGDDIAASGKKAAEFFVQLEKAALKFFAVLTVGRGLADFTRTVISGGAQLDRMSTRLGVSADTLSRWQGAVRQSGGSAESFMGTIQGISAELTEIKKTGDSPLITFFGQIGASLVNTNGTAKTTIEILKEIGNVLETGKLSKASNADKFNLLTSNGIDEGTANLLLKGKRERERLLSSQKAYSDADARSARLAQEKWEGVKLNIERTSQAIVIKLLPVLERLTNAMLKFADTAVPILLQVGDAIGVLDDKTNGWSTALLGVLATLRLIGGAGVLSGITRLAGSLGGVIAAALLLKGDESESSKDAKQLSGKAEVDRAAAEKLAKIQLENQWWRTMFGGKITEQDIQQRADQIQGYKTIPSPNVGGSPQSSTGGSRAQRNNNPGNIEFNKNNNWEGQLPNDPSKESRFARFDSAENGVRALAKLLSNYGKTGTDTVQDIVERFAPKKDGNDTRAYIDALTKRMGVAPNEQLDLNNPTTLSGLIKGISRHESGSDYLTDQQVMTGIQRNGGGQGGAGNSISIGEVKLYTQATDATGIARDFRGAMVRQADTGVR